MLWLILEIASCLVVTGVSAQASAYVPIMDPAYRELDALAAIGLVEVPSLVQRPYSRLVFGRLTKQARINLDSSPDTEDRFLETLARLKKEFAIEIALLCDDMELPC